MAGGASSEFGVERRREGGREVSEWRSEGWLFLPVPGPRAARLEQQEVTIHAIWSSKRLLTLAEKGERTRKVPRLRRSSQRSSD